ncbi:helicase-related protein [Desulfosarcina ovata]|nr:helicase-related protein [Desulfosarcina ovata]
MRERSQMIEWIRGEIIGPARSLVEPQIAGFHDRTFDDPLPFRQGSLAWLPDPAGDLQEILYYERESPHRKYGAGVLHPECAPQATPDQAALNSMDTIGADPEAEELDNDDVGADSGGDGDSDPIDSGSDITDDFEVTSPDIRHPSTIGISFCARLKKGSKIDILLPQKRYFAWQPEDSPEFLLNGRYEACERQWTDRDGNDRGGPAWRRRTAVLNDTRVSIERSEMIPNKLISKTVAMPEGSPLSLQIEILPRLQDRDSDTWLLTVVIKNSPGQAHSQNPKESSLFQAFFEVKVIDGSLEKYPESLRPFDDLDPEEQSLALLYRESATWGIGHGCAAGWDAEPGDAPSTVYADVMPAVELPSMTPDIEVDGQQLRLSMRSLATMPEDGNGPEWQSLQRLVSGYADWILQIRGEASGIPQKFAGVAARHLDACQECLERIERGIDLLRSDVRVLKAFKLANLSMLLQQIASKQLPRRPLTYDAALRIVTPEGEYQSPWNIYENELEDSERLGTWRAFQIAYLIMSLEGTYTGASADREMVDLIWFPTGGGKTEAYLAVMAFYMFHERLVIEREESGVNRDGTNVIMRYTLRMLTTQQFQRAASLICAMEYLRRNNLPEGMNVIPGRRFSLGLWIGGDGSPNKIAVAKKEIAEFRNGYTKGNPLVITECPWCRAEIGRYNGPYPRSVRKDQRKQLCLRGITESGTEGPLLHCPDGRCSFGGEFPESWLPVEVIDERIYRHPPSLIISTADKLAIIAFRPEAGILFGRRVINGEMQQVHKPPGLIIQDELHLISGPLGTMYALYETIIERFCSYEENGRWVKPKLIASTATVRGAAEQVNALYARNRFQLFPSPGLTMGDSFFGKYARDEEGRLQKGRLYLGIHANDYGSVLTTQVRAFSSALFRPYTFAQDARDPWWSLLAFYNSIRELGGARTLFDSDIRSRLKFMFNREGYTPKDRRHLRIIEELTSRLSQAEIVQMLDRLSETYKAGRVNKSIDACLASNIIEVGVDIDRLSLMSVVGQPKTTASYIQVTGRVGRRWWERPGLILMIYNPSKSRDRSHFEQFHSYHRRLYERVEPTTATPFALSSIQRGAMGAMIAWARQYSDAPVYERAAYAAIVESCHQLLSDRCRDVHADEDLDRSLRELRRNRDILLSKWGNNPQLWHEFPQKINGEYLMLWPGQFASRLQQQNSITVPSSMRQVDRSAELQITQGYVVDDNSDVQQPDAGPESSSTSDNL